MKNSIKIVSLAASLSASALLGDCYDINDRFVNPIYYRETLIAGGFYNRPFDLRKEYRINDEGFLEVYFGDGKMYPVKEGMRINERSLSEHVRDEAKTLLKEGSKKVRGLFDTVREFSHDVYEGIKDE